ncbi:MAG: HAMP domain-containing sensor histidine kinase, partial [Gemmatimonadota bacterium]
TGLAFGRIGWLATTLLLAIVLLFSSWSNYRGAINAAGTVTRGQSELLEGALRPLIPQFTNDSLANENLRTFVATHEGAGVRYVALLEPDGRVSASAGSPEVPTAMPPPDSMPAPGQYTVYVGDRVRVYFVRPFPRGLGPPPDGMRGDRRADSRARDPRPGTSGTGTPPQPTEPRRMRAFHYALIEFEPVMAQGLVARAESSFLLTCIGAAILTLAALLFWRISQKYDNAREHFEKQKRLTVLGEMSAVLAHEIRNPLASLKGNAQLLAERLPEASKDQSRAQRVVTEATRLEALTTDLLDFARTGPVELQPVSPVGVLQNAIGDVAEHGFDVDAAGAPATWRIDANRIRHALVNLLQNARQASPEGSKPRVTVRTDRNMLVYEVRDFGPGLPEGNAERIFDPFFTTRTNGTGLGLAVARRTAELHGGLVSAHNHADGGAVFRIELPQAAG